MRHTPYAVPATHKQIESLARKRCTPGYVQCIGVGPKWYLLLGGSVVQTMHDAWEAKWVLDRAIQIHGVGE